jgi:hypothetical protein
MYFNLGQVPFGLTESFAGSSCGRSPATYKVIFAMARMSREQDPHNNKGVIL